MQAALATCHRAPTWFAPHQGQLGWEREQQHHSLPGNMVINFNRAPAKDLTGLHSAVEVYTLASHEPCGGDSCSHPGSCEISASCWDGWDLVGASALPRAFKTQNAQGFGTFLKQLGNSLWPLSSGQWFPLQCCTGEQLGIFLVKTHLRKCRADKRTTVWGKWLSPD